MAEERITDQLVIDTAWELYFDQYKAGKSINAIAKDSKVSRNGLKLRLQRAGMYESRPSTRVPSDRCAKGHDMAEHGRQIYKNGVKNGRYCIECKRERQRVKK